MPLAVPLVELELALSDLQRLDSGLKRGWWNPELSSRPGRA